MNKLLALAERQLRGHAVLSPASGQRYEWRLQCAVVLCFGCCYGLTMGSYAGVEPERWLHLGYTGLKVPLLLGATFLISWPSFAVANQLLGLGVDLRACWRALLSGQSIVAITLASLAPLTAFYYVTVRDYKLALLCNATMFALASFAGQYAMRRSYRQLIHRDPRHAKMLWVWIAIYGFVGVQLAWVLRPFVGSPNEAIQFIRGGQLSNAYVEIARLLWGALAGG